MTARTASTNGRGRGRGAIVSVLDLGSTKVVCVVARLTPVEPGEALPGRTHAIEVLGIGHVRSHGVKSGAVANLDAAERAIRQAVDAAERMAGVTINSLIVSLTAGRLQSETRAAAVDAASGAGRRGRYRPCARRWPPAVRPGSGAPSSIRCPSATRSTGRAASPIRAA